MLADTQWAVLELLIVAYYRHSSVASSTKAAL